MVKKNTTQKMKFSIKDFFSKCDQIRRKLRISSHLLKKSLMENFIFCAVKAQKTNICWIKELLNRRNFLSANIKKLREFHRNGKEYFKWCLRVHVRVKLLHYSYFIEVTYFIRSKQRNFFSCRSSKNVKNGFRFDFLLNIIIENQIFLSVFFFALRYENLSNEKLIS